MGKGISTFAVTAMACQLMVPCSLLSCSSSSSIEKPTTKDTTADRISCSLGMVAVPAGKFLTGCKDVNEKECMSLEEPQREEVIEKPFCIDRTEVTNEQYSRCIQAGKCSPIAEDRCGIFSRYIDQPVARFIGGVFVDYVDKEGHEGTSWNGQAPMQSDFHAIDHPVVCVTWEEANAFCEWAGKRLPTDTEWEKASRGTDGRMYPWGAEKPSCEHAVMYGGDAGCGRKTTWPVGSKPNGTSPYGALDMSGNVWEWVEDECHDQKGTMGHYIRGGSWVEEEYYLFHASFKGCRRPTIIPGVHIRGTLRSNDLGFRCASDSKIYYDAAE